MKSYLEKVGVTGDVVLVNECNQHWQIFVKQDAGNESRQSWRSSPTVNHALHWNALTTAEVLKFKLIPQYKDNHL